MVKRHESLCLSMHSVKFQMHTYFYETNLLTLYVYTRTHTYVHVHTLYPFIVAPQPQTDFDSSSTAPPDVSHSGSTVADTTTNIKEPSPPPASAPHIAKPRVFESQDQGAHSSGGHVDELSEARLDEVASRLVADALSRAVQRCYTDKLGDAGRQVNRGRGESVVCYIIR